MRFHAAISAEQSWPWPLLFGHFLPWYTLRGGDFPLEETMGQPPDVMPDIEDYRHWNDRRAGYQRTHLQMPAIGCYDSRDPNVIEWQIKTAQAHGVDGFIINWYGKNSVENVLTLHWLAGLDRWNRQHPGRPFLYFISFDSQAQWPTEGKTPVSMQVDFEYIRDHLIRDAYLRRDGRPVFTVFPYEQNCAQWRTVLDRVFGVGGADLVWSGFARGEGENACYAWVQPDPATIDLKRPCVWSDPGNPGDGFLRMLYQNANAGGHRPAYIIHGVWPEFNNQLVAWAWSRNPRRPDIRPSVICRESNRGNTLELTWGVYLEYLRTAAPDTVPAPLIQLVTWNDYAETTVLEPTRDHGTAPLEYCYSMKQEAARIMGQET
jgi:hypothetical protein